jgi:hypothetical protein
MKIKNIVAILFTVLFAAACSDQQDFGNPLAGIPKEPGPKKIQTSAKMQSNSFDILVTEMLKTSPRFEQLTKGYYSHLTENIGISYGIIMEGSPHQEMDKSLKISRSYVFSVYRSSEFGKLNIGYFTFNPRNKQLYEYDVNKRQLNEIEFDRDLLLKYEALLITNAEFVN